MTKIIICKSQKLANQYIKHRFDYYYPGPVKHVSSYKDMLGLKDIEALALLNDLPDEYDRIRVYAKDHNINIFEVSYDG